MSDHTFIEHVSPIKLIARLEQSTDPNAREAARRWVDALKRPGRRVADAFGIEPSRDRRDRIIRDLAGEGSLRQQAESVRQKVSRYRPQPSDRAAAGERCLLSELDQIGLLDLSERQIRRILGGR